MTTLRAPINRRPFEHMIEIYAPSHKRETFESFSGKPVKSEVTVYEMLHRYRMMYEGISRFEMADIGITVYTIPSTVELSSLDDRLLSKYVLQQPKKRSEPIRESLSTLKPEIVGLGLGGAISFGISMFALATHNTGLATVMAGPFIASILGFTLLLLGLKRKK